MDRVGRSSPPDSSARSGGGPRRRLRAAAARRAALPNRLYHFGRRRKRQTERSGRSLALHVQRVPAERDEPEAPPAGGAQAD